MLDMVVYDTMPTINNKKWKIEPKRLVTFEDFQSPKG